MTFDGAYRGPLPEAEVERCCTRAGVTFGGLELVREIRASHPDSNVNLHQGEVRVKGEFRSLKMGMTFDCRDIGGEIPRAFEVDMNKAILEAWPRPFPIRGVRYVPRYGARTVSTCAKPFLLIIESKHVYFNFVISGDAIKTSVDGGSTLYVRRGNEWGSPPLEEAVERYGIGIVLTDKQRFTGHFMANAALLHRARFHSPEEVPPDQSRAVLEMVQKDGCANRRALLDKRIISADNLNILVANELLYFPLHEQDYTDLPSTFVFRDRAAYELWLGDRMARARDCPLRRSPIPRRDDIFSLDEATFKIISVPGSANLAPSSQLLGDVYYEGDDKALRYMSVHAFLTLKDQGKLILQQEDASVDWLRTRPEDIEMAQFRLKVIRGEIEPRWQDTGHNKVRKNQLISAQTIDSWRVSARKAREQGKAEIDGLLTNERLRGNRDGKIEEEVELIMDEAVDDFFEQKGVAPSKVSFAGEVKLRCEALGLPAPSRRTTDRRLEKEDKCYLVERQKGPYARYESDGFVSREFRSRIIDTKVPFMLAHADHTPLPFKCPSVFGDYFYGRQLWYSALVDQAMDHELAFMLSYDQPSGITTVILILLCAAHWNGHIPTFVATDNALDFKGNLTVNVLSEGESHHLYRPPRCPRFGSIAELGNNSLVQKLRSLAGNTLAVRDFYGTSPGFAAKDVANVTLPELSAHLTGFFLDKFDLPGPHTNGMTRRDFMRTQTGELGELHSPSLTISDHLLIRCMPYARGETRQVRTDGYIECNGLAYRGIGKGIRHLAGKRVWVKVDRFCGGRVWVVPPGGGWIECRSDFYEMLRHFTEHEVVEYMGYLRDAKVLRGNDPVANGAIFVRHACHHGVPAAIVAARRCTREALIATDAAIFVNADPLQSSETQPAVYVPTMDKKTLKPQGLRSGVLH
ncbi:hypothetical protein [Paraburkholderia hospita]|uniref:hypothetical protein n=1 Tax=Paraburkholderia hospita TaxID=169430 RepID=UPI000271BEB1|nr:hypothetical protein [Paraburkholderia hospita]EUC16541.1 hypothetical protein PMI06_004875 [Burkholderia sp. BT03]SKC77825.1 hypothetical protein SAMN06266956_3151 [Paraburkholderia hospita]